jgi:hypothetical protein
MEKTIVQDEVVCGLKMELRAPQLTAASERDDGVLEDVFARGGPTRARNNSSKYRQSPR